MGIAYLLLPAPQALCKWQPHTQPGGAHPSPVLASHTGHLLSPADHPGLSLVTGPKLLHGPSPAPRHLVTGCPHAEGQVGIQVVISGRRQPSPPQASGCFSVEWG